MSKKKTRITILAVLLLLFLAPRMAAADMIGYEALLTGRTDSPVTVSLSSPAYKSLAQFGQERTESLNRLLKHIAVSVSLDGEITETTIETDGESVCSWIETDLDSVRRTVYSFDPETGYDQADAETVGDSPAFAAFLEDHFFLLNRLLDDLYPVFEKSASAFQDKARKTTTNISFRGYGRGVRSLIIPIPDEYVKAHFPDALADLAETEESRSFISGLVFSGTQKIVLLYDQEDHLLRINYDGTVGLTPESMRKVSVVWRCLRTDGIKKDNLTLKTPSVKGNDRYNAIYTREIDLSDSAKHTVTWDLQIDLKEDQVRKKIQFSADLATADGAVGGKAVFSEKQDGAENRITIIPALKKENSAEYSGTIEITGNSGKIVTSSSETAIRISAGRELTMPEIRTAVSSDAVALQDQISGILIRRLLLLPPEDLDYLTLDIPDELWDSLAQSIF